MTAPDYFAALAPAADLPQTLQAFLEPRVPETWRHPTEWNSVTKVYPDFGTWALSAGTSASNWYQGRMDEPLIFK